MLLWACKGINVLQAAKKLVKHSYANVVCFVFLSLSPLAVSIISELEASIIHLISSPDRVHQIWHVYAVHIVPCVRHAGYDAFFLGFWKAKEKGLGVIDQEQRNRGEDLLATNAFKSSRNSSILFASYTWRTWSLFATSILSTNMGCSAMPFFCYSTACCAYR